MVNEVIIWVVQFASTSNYRLVAPATPEDSDDEDLEETHTASALNLPHTNIVLMNIENNIDYIKLKDILTFSEFQMYIYIFTCSNLY